MLLCMFIVFELITQAERWAGAHKYWVLLLLEHEPTSYMIQQEYEKTRIFLNWKSPLVESLFQDVQRNPKKRHQDKCCIARQKKFIN